ncbi:MAG: outer membrane protein assembly factor BamD [Bacteroidales bacterium]|nr:outer membrane protein assembly factor BamD [Bacteroidales bacterium]
MFFSRFKIYILLAILVLASCGKHQKLIKSTDNEAKYAAAVDYYEKNDYYRALQLFQQLINFYQGTEKAEKMQFYYAYCYYHQRDYVLASYYFKRFVNNYPRSALAEEAMFMNAYCYFLDSPNSSLDQTNTLTAIKELQLFINLYPNSARVEEANKLIDQLRAKLQRKDLDIANLYLKMRLYEAAISSFKNILKDFPDSEYKEEILFSILKSYYNYASFSISVKQPERYQSALDSYNELVFQFPDTKYLKEAKNMNRDVLDHVQGRSSTKKNSDIN